MPAILVTRPEQDAEATAARLRDLGFTPIVAPLMAVDVAVGPVLDLGGARGLLMTSANGVRAFAERQAGVLPDLPVFCVGDATARAARAAGFGNVESAGGDVDDLARLVMDRLPPGDGPLLHVAGTKVAGDLAGLLAAGGYAYRREVLYEARGADMLPEAAAAALRAGAAAGVLLHSPRSAALFDRLVTDAGLRGACGEMTAYCLSANVAAKAGAPWAAVRVAARPTEDDLMDLLAVSAP